MSAGVARAAARRCPRAAARLLTNIATTTIDLGEDGEETWVITGDIPAMWLRDSCLQLSPLLRLAPRHPELAGVAAGLLRRHWRMILVDPHANAFNRRPSGNRWDDDRPRQGPWVWERKWELDSLTFPLDLALRLDGLGCREWLNADFYDAFDVILTITETEQRHEAASRIASPVPGLPHPTPSHARAVDPGPGSAGWSSRLSGPATTPVSSVSTFPETPSWPAPCGLWRPSWIATGVLGRSA